MRLAIIGCGLIGQKRAGAAASLGIPVVAVADADPLRAENLGAASKNGPGRCKLVGRGASGRRGRRGRCYDP